MSQKNKRHEPWNIFSNPASQSETVSIGNLQKDVSLSKLKNTLIFVHLSTMLICLIPAISPALPSPLFLISFPQTSKKPSAPSQHGRIRLNSTPKRLPVSDR